MKMKLTVILLFMIFMLSCGGMATKQKYNEFCEAQINRNISEFMEVFGYPERTIKLPNENTVYVFYRDGGATGFSQRISQQQTIMHTVQRYCQTFVETEKDTGRILKIKPEGNDCKMK